MPATPQLSATQWRERAAALKPRGQVFIDGRAEVYYPNGVFDDEMKIHRVTAGWADALDKRQVDVVLTNRSGALAGALDRQPEWKRAFSG